MGEATVVLFFCRFFQGGNRGANNFLAEAQAKYVDIRAVLLVYTPPTASAVHGFGFWCFGLFGSGSRALGLGSRAIRGAQQSGHKKNPAFRLGFLSGLSGS